MDAGLPLGPSAQEADAAYESPDAGLQPASSWSFDAGVEPHVAPASVELNAQAIVEPALVEPAIAVEVRARSKSEQLRRSPLAVSVVDVSEAKRGAADLGEVLARVEGVAVRRSGGLGSDQRFSLAGLEGEQIRFFLDGVPLDLAGYPFGVSNVPINAIERVEIHRGVVPIRFGADALGGALNLVSKTLHPGAHAAASYQGGSFDTHRGTLSMSYATEHAFVRADAFADYSANDYPVTVPGALADGTPTRERLRRFHDAYRAEGASIMAGVVNRPWADRLSLRGFVTDYEKELQSDVVMVEPYGEATSSGRSAGASAAYRKAFDALELDLTAGYAYGLTGLRDLSMCRYDWTGRCTPSAKAGEIRDVASNSALKQHAGFGRANASYEPATGQRFGLSLSPTYIARGGDERYRPRPDSRDPLDAERRLITFVSGLDYTLSALSSRFEAVLFGKSYLQYKRSEELLRNGDPVRRDEDIQRFGGGASARFAPIEELWFKASYEYATRLPSAEETFGNGILIDPNLQLQPELSHNGNLSVSGDASFGQAGRFQGELLGFMRDAKQLIFLITGASNTQRYENAASARSLGGQASVSYSSVSDYLRLEANGTYQSFRNTSETGPFALFRGDRMPYRPYLFANAAARGQLPGVFGAQDKLSLSYALRYTHGFYRNWESAGQRATKERIPTQIVHSLTLGYLVQRTRNASMSFAIELQNLTDARVFDFFGVEKPGRAVFAKCVAEL